MKVNIYYHCSCGFSIDMAGDFVAFVESAVLLFRYFTFFL